MEPGLSSPRNITGGGCLANFAERIIRGMRRIRGAQKKKANHRK
jgi:hypothetical protein